MNYIKHRVNLISDLKILNPQFGAEIDLRSDISAPSKIHLSHDPWTKGDDLEDWLDQYKKNNSTGTVIFNTKEDGLENEVISLARKFNIHNYFFLDTAFPTFIKFITENMGEYFAIRVSEYEGVANALQFKNHKFKNQIKWIWADCFHGIALRNDVFETLEKDFQICLVSPELQKKTLDSITTFKHLKTKVHSICTKNPELWE